MKTTLELPDELMRELKVRAAIEGKKLREVVAEALRVRLLSTSHVHPESRRVSVKTDPTTTLPVVAAVTDSPATGMTREEVIRTEQDAQYREDVRRAGLAP